MNNCRAGFIGIVGLPNAGKSTLLNMLLKEKLSIVTPKPQTTRQRIQGIVTEDQSQFIFVDSPGWVQSKSGLNPWLLSEFESIVEQVDALAVLFNRDAKRLSDFEVLLEVLEKSSKPWVPIITKSDLKVDIGIKPWLESAGFHPIEVSGHRGKEKNRRLVLDTLAEVLPQSPGLLFDPELYTTQNYRELAAELIREKCFLFLHQEIPFQLAVEIQRFDESRAGQVDILANILVAKENHKMIVVGRGAQTIKRIGIEARKELERLLNCKVNLKTHVKCKLNWFKQPSMLKELGYVHPQA